MPQVTKRGDCFDAWANGRTMQFVVLNFTNTGKIEALRVTPANASQGTRLSQTAYALSIQSAEPSTLPERDQKNAAAMLGSSETTGG